jgi:acyl-CoA thioesterase I
MLLGQRLYNRRPMSSAKSAFVSAVTVAGRDTYLSEIGRLCRIDWPGNRTIHVVCHGHSVPAGYFATPEVRNLEAYPHLLHVGLAERFGHAVINVIVTAIGGENSEQGAKRFEGEVLNHRPDVVTIDYALNDRGIGLERARQAWTGMITQAQDRGVKVLLLTPTPDLSANLESPEDPLNQHAEQVRRLAGEFCVGLVDSLVLFQQFARSGGQVASLMSQVNHPNREGHELVARAMLEWFR